MEAVVIGALQVLAQVVVVVVVVVVRLAGGAREAGLMMDRVMIMRGKRTRKRRTHAWEGVRVDQGAAVGMQAEAVVTLQLELVVLVVTVVVVVVVVAQGGCE
jgi:hypothetical protein